MQKKEEYVYRQHLRSEHPYEEVEINHKNFFGKLFCKHEFAYLVRRKKNQKFFSLKGDTVEIICPKCGKSQGTMLWEYGGMGYR